MYFYLRFASPYLALAFVLVFFLRENPLVVFQIAWVTSTGHMPLASLVAAALLAVSLLFRLMTRTGSEWQLIIAVLLSLLATVMFHSAFSLIKTSMPIMVPFWADPLFAGIDKALHFGTDPWQITHWLAQYLPMKAIPDLYLSFWLPPAICLPVFLAAFDSNAARVRRFLILYILAWVFVGHVLALAGMSAGPVYYDRLLGGVRFAELTAALEASALNGTLLMEVQQYLWENYTERSQAIGSGISAFPSVHVSVAMVCAMYLAERWRFLVPVAVLYVAGILFMSVYSGYHYAIDGYVSILVMLLSGLWLRRREMSQTTGLTQDYGAFELTSRRENG